jgi:excisionase family DNA binding protein
MPVKRRSLSRTETPCAVAEASVSPRLLRIPQCAAYLSCSVWAIRDLLRRKELAKIQLGKKFLVDIADLDAWIQSAKRTGRAA